MQTGARGVQHVDLQSAWLAALWAGGRGGSEEQCGVVTLGGPLQAIQKGWEGDQSISAAFIQRSDERTCVFRSALFYGHDAARSRRLSIVFVRPAVVVPSACPRCFVSPSAPPLALLPARWSARRAPSHRRRLPRRPLFLPPPPPLFAASRTAVCDSWRPRPLANLPPLLLTSIPPPLPRSILAWRSGRVRASCRTGRTNPTRNYSH